MEVLCGENLDLVKKDPKKEYFKLILIILIFIGCIGVLQWGMLDYQGIPNFSNGSPLRLIADQQSPLVMGQSLLIETGLGMLLFWCIWPLRKAYFKLAWPYAVMAFSVFLVTAFSIVITMFLLFGGIPLLSMFFILSGGTSGSLQLYIGVLVMSFFWGNNGIIRGKERWWKMILSYVIILVISAIVWNLSNYLMKGFPVNTSGLICALLHVLSGICTGTALVWMSVPFNKNQYKINVPYLCLGGGLLLLEVVLLVLFGSGALAHNLFSLFLFQEKGIVLLSTLCGVIVIQGFYKGEIRQ